jgi:phosphatidylglycerol lysyltransferase
MSGAATSHQPRKAPSRLQAAWASVTRAAARLRDSPVVRVGAPVLVLAAAVWIARKAWTEIRPHDLLKALEATSPLAILGSAVLTAVSYACLAVQEWYALRVVRQPQPLAPTAATSFAGHVLSSFMGFGLATGAAVRLRLYRWARLGPRKTAALWLVCSLANYLSGLVAVGACLAARPGPPASALGWPPALVLGFGVLLMTPSALWFVLFPQRSHAKGASHLGPGSRLYALALGVADWITSGAALFVLSPHAAADLAPFLAVFCVGSLVGALVGIPGGVGVLEATVLRYGGGSAHQTAAALILYRMIYFVGPLAITAVGLLVDGLRRAGRKAGLTSRKA